LDRSHSIRCWICWFSETWDETSRSWTLNVFAPSCRQVRALVLLDLLDKGWILVTWCAAKICQESSSHRSESHWGPVGNYVTGEIRYDNEVLATLSAVITSSDRETTALATPATAAT
jgi:hypothetical protein